MTGLYMCEVIMRADAHSISIVAPGSLVERWRLEPFEKFGSRRQKANQTRHNNRLARAWASRI